MSAWYETDITHEKKCQSLLVVLKPITCRVALLRKSMVTYGCRKPICSCIGDRRALQMCRSHDVQSPFQVTLLLLLVSSKHFLLLNAGNLIECDVSSSQFISAEVHAAVCMCMWCESLHCK